jgi:FAD/FMN-containing dehydrogenase
VSVRPPLPLEQLGCHVVRQGSETWAESCTAWNTAVAQRPVAVAYPASAEEMVEVVGFARDNGLRVAFNAGGHNAGPIAWDEPTLLVRTERFRGVEIDPGARRARIKAGTLAEGVAAAAGEHGLAYLAGTSADVGLVGYALGGGFSWLVRKHGLAANTITRIELVTADGTLRTADAGTNSDLFWAVRGGGGNFGAVTMLELELFPIEQVYAGCLFWPIERAAEILAAWRAWVDGVPEECSSLGRLLKVPDLPFIPEHLRNRDFVLVELCFLGSDAGGRELTAPLRALSPEFDTAETMPASALTIVNMDPPAPLPYHGEGMTLTELDGEAIRRVVPHFLETSLAHFEVRQLGGAAARSAPEHGAIDRIEAPFMSFSFGLAFDDEAHEAVPRQLAELEQLLAPWDAGTRVLSFAETACDPAKIYLPESYERLRQLKGRWDPDGRFAPNHPIPPLP